MIWALVIIVASTLVFVYRLERPAQITPMAIVVIIESTVTIVGILYALFIGFAWHYPIFKGWLVRVPDVRGTWVGTLTPLDAAGNPMSQIDCNLVVRQNLFSVTCVLSTERARSQSFAGSAYIDDDSDEERLIYTYRTIPVLADRVKNASRDGTAILTLARKSDLAGTYFTDRCTRGAMTLKLSSRRTKQ